MDHLIKAFINQLEVGLKLGRNFEITAAAFPSRKIVIFGMGGSGIGGDFVSAILSNEIPVPVMVKKGYHFPEYIDQTTLVILSSYSGNTEETLSVLEKAAQRKAKIVCISSGGKLEQLAGQKGLDFFALPKGWPSPRACVGFSIIAQLFIVAKNGFFPVEKLISQLEKTILFLKEQEAYIKIQAKEIAIRLHGKNIIIYGPENIEAVLIRFRQQLNENSKMLCWHHVLPEMNHNELVGWADFRENTAVVFLENGQVPELLAKRISITKEIILQKTDTILNIKSHGSSLMEELFYLIHLVDWTSWFLAGMKGVDPDEIKVIDYLKTQMSRL